MEEVGVCIGSVFILRCLESRQLRVALLPRPAQLASMTYDVLDTTATPSAHTAADGPSYHHTSSISCMVDVSDGSCSIAYIAGNRKPPDYKQP